jgi:hypothetical protein
MKIYLLALTTLLLTACQTVPKDYAPELHEKAKNIVLHAPTDRPQQPYTVVKFVRSNSCNSKSGNRIVGDLDEAKLLLQLEAAKSGADAVVDYKCWTNAVDMVSNCWASKRCEGNAVKFK